MCSSQSFVALHPCIVENVHPSSCKIRYRTRKNKDKGHKNVLNLKMAL